jgi:hypothetical protein
MRNAAFRPIDKLGIDECGLGPEQRRMLFAQIVDDPGAPDESAILEGKPYKYFLHRCARTTSEALRKLENKNTTYRRLNRQPDLFRGEVVSRLGVVIEVAEAVPTPEYELEGYKILPAMFVSTERDLYELRILVPANSPLCVQLHEGFELGRCPVVRVTGFFMKCHSRRTAVVEEPPWRRPLLVTPPPEMFDRAVDAKGEMIETKTLKFLPSSRIYAPGAEERLVMEVVRGPQEEWGEQLPPQFKLDGLSVFNAYDSAKRHLERLRQTLPEDQRSHPAAVVVRGRWAPASGITQALDALNAAGFHRVAVKDENDSIMPDRDADEFPRRRPPGPPETR